MALPTYSLSNFLDTGDCYDNSEDESADDERENKTGNVILDVESVGCQSTQEDGKGNNREDGNGCVTGDGREAVADVDAVAVHGFYYT